MNFVLFPSLNIIRPLTGLLSWELQSLTRWSGHATGCRGPRAVPIRAISAVGTSGTVAADRAVVMGTTITNTVIRVQLMKTRNLQPQLRQLGMCDELKHCQCHWSNPVNPWKVTVGGAAVEKSPNIAEAVGSYVSGAGCCAGSGVAVTQAQYPWRRGQRSHPPRNVVSSSRNAGGSARSDRHGSWKFSPAAHL